MVNVITIALLSAFVGAIADVYAKGILNSTDTRSFVTMNFVSMAFVMTLVGPFFFELSLTGLAIPLLVGIFLLDAAANYFAFDALKNGDVSHVSPLVALAPMFTLMFSTALLPSSVSIKVVVGVIGIVSSIYFLNLYGNPWEPFRTLKRKDNLFGIVSAGLFGLSAVLSKFALSIYEVTNVLTLFWIRSVVVTLIFLLVFRNALHFEKKTGTKIFMRAILVIGQWLLYLTAISEGNVVVASSAAETVPVFILFMAYFAYREKITKQKLAAVSIVVLSLVYLGL